MRLTNGNGREKEKRIERGRGDVKVFIEYNDREMLLNYEYLSENNLSVFLLEYACICCRFFFDSQKKFNGLWILNLNACFITRQFRPYLNLT